MMPKYKIGDFLIESYLCKNYALEIIDIYSNHYYYRFLLDGRICLKQINKIDYPERIYTSYTYRLMTNEEKMELL